MLQEEELKSLHESYNDTYILLKDTDVGNGLTLKAGTRIKLYFKSGSDSIKVYAYLTNQERESVLGKNILYLFDTDFPESEYNRKFLDAKLEKLMRKAK